MASAASVYLWCLLAASGLDGALRLGRTRQVAQLQSERLEQPAARRKRKWMGLASILGSPLALLYGVWQPIPAWLWISVIYGVVAGFEYLTAARFFSYPKLIWHTRIFGVCSAAIAATIYFGFLRR
ncbi:MAG TPA: hypothetical protein VFM10_05290 [Terriglobales bacterium]|nr:hypothetical protein [Terriglobales bacterium]